nr:ABC transporter ATP-binding protein/permease [Lachnospiraceae bacterium]
MSKEKKGFSLLLKWSGRNKYYIYLSIVLALISSVSGIVPYIIFYKVIDLLVLKEMTVALAVKLAVILIGTTVLRVSCNLFASISSHKGAYNTLFNVRCMVTEHMAKMPLGRLNERSTGEIKYVMNESIEKMELFLAHNLPELVLYLTGPIVMFVFLLRINAKLGLLSIVPLIPVIVVMAIMFMRFFKFMDAVNSSSGRLSGSVGEYVNGMRLIKAYNMSVRSFRKYSDAIESQRKLWCDISKATGPFYAAYIILLECGILMLVPAGGYMYVHGHITAGVLLVFAFIGTQYLTDIRPLQELSNNLSFVKN